MNANCTCPYCFNDFSLYNVKFRCKNNELTLDKKEKCKSETDKVLGKNLRRVIEINNPVKYGPIPKKIKCDNCNVETLTRICPECHNELPYSFDGSNKHLIFGIIGTTSAGKSHYIASLLKIIKNEMSFSFNVSCVINSVSQKRVDKIHEQVYGKKESLDATAIENTDVKLPIVFTLRFKRKSLLRNVDEECTISLFDTAGEAMDSIDYMSKYIYKSSGLIFLIDPRQIDGLQKQQTDEDLPVKKTSQIIETMINYCRENTDLDMKEINKKTPVAIAISKFDKIESEFDEASILNSPGSHAGVLNIDHINAINTEIMSFISTKEEANVIRLIEDYFSNYSFFGVSALGSNPVEDKKIDKIRPKRIEDPFLWLLWKNGVIKSNQMKLFVNKILHNK